MLTRGTVYTWTADSLHTSFGSWHIARSWIPLVSAVDVRVRVQGYWVRGQWL